MEQTVKPSAQDWLTADGWIHTFTGKRFHPMTPRVEDMDILDIAHALSNTCRYTGHCSHFYSVAQHSVHVSNSLPSEFRFWGLMHDAAEAYIADIARPTKRHLYVKEAAGRWQGFKKYSPISEIENRILAVVADKFGLCYPMPKEIKHADNTLLMTEVKALMPDIHSWGDADAKPDPNICIIPWQPVRAKQEFLSLFRKLKGAVCQPG